MSDTEVDAVGSLEIEASAKVFISYSRTDGAFADRLDAALKARGFEPLIDRTEIFAFEDWWDRIEALIAQSDTVVFVLSPDAVASDICAKEVEFAASLHKRFAPVVCRLVEPNAIPEPLRRLNLIFCEDGPNFEASMNQLAEALSTDIAWVRKHTEFSTHARRWETAGRPGPRGLLLRSPVLEEAEQWIATRPRGAPDPTDATLAFIAESRRAATQRRNVLTAIWPSAWWPLSRWLDWHIGSGASRSSSAFLRRAGYRRPRRAGGEQTARRQVGYRSQT